MIYYLVAIILITLLFVSLYRMKVIVVCPICAGVVLTWLGGTIALYSGAAWANPVIIAILMGASMGALAEKYGSKFGFVWKIVVVLLGLPAIYFIVQKQLWQGAVLIAVLMLWTVFSKSQSKNSSNHNQDLFKNCC